MSATARDSTPTVRYQPVLLRWCSGGIDRVHGIMFIMNNASADHAAVGTVLKSSAASPNQHGHRFKGCGFMLAQRPCGWRWISRMSRAAKC